MIKSRIYFTFFIFTVLFFLVLSKAFYIQIWNKKKLQEYSKSQLLREVEIYPYRGNIYDRNGSPLALNIQTYSIFTIPKAVDNPEMSYKKLSQIVPEVSYEEIYEKTKNRRNYTWLARNIKLNEKQILQIKEIDGIYTELSPSRYYPNHELLAQALGFVGVDNTGLSGIEYEFNEVLKGKVQVIKYVKDAKGRAIKFESNKLEQNSQDIILTIDKDLQSIAERYLKETVEEFKALKGGVGIIDVRTGQILAIANYPSYDPNFVQRYEAKKRKLSFISDPIEPGSIFKILTVASALKNNIVNSKTNYYCERGRFKVENHIISEAEAVYQHEWLTVEEIIKYSSNIGTTKIAFDITFPKLKQTLKEFNIGEKTGVELPGESRGILTDKDNVRPLTLSNISFGQGVATTGIQMLAAYAAIANDGVYMSPTIVKKETPKQGRRILSIATARQLQEMLVRAVEEGTGKNAIIPYFTIAGKTSTAQKAIKGEGYQAYIPGFIGFTLNVKKPFVIYAYIEEPSSDEGYYGNQVAAPLFKKIAEYMLFRNKEYNNLALEEIDEKQHAIDTIRVKQSATRIQNLTSVPNFIGLDKKSSSALAGKMKIKIKQRGIGIVNSQNPLPGSNLKPNLVVELIYGPPRYE